MKSAKTSAQRRTRGSFRAVPSKWFEELERRALMAVVPPMLQPPVPLLNPATIPQFVNDITPGGSFFDTFKHAPDNPLVPNDFTVGAYPIEQDLGLGLKNPDGTPVKTPLFGYGTSPGTASYPGASFVVQEGQPIAVTWVNGLPEAHVVNIDPSLLDGVMSGMPALTYDPANNAIAGGIPAVPHLHGGHTDAIYDGTPMQWWNSITHGQDYIDTQAYGNPTQPANTFTYRNDQQAATLWYHDHAMGVTRLNAYAGMAGFYVIRNQWDTGIPDDPATPQDENPLDLPAGKYDVGLAIQDKQFLSDGRLWFPAMAQTLPDGSTAASTLPEMFGDTILVNGKAWPKMDVEPRRYRFRLLNGADSAFFTMTITTPTGTTSAIPIWQIGTDDGLLNAPVKTPTLTVAPGERADVIVDFSKFKPGTKFIVRNSGQQPFPNGARPLAGLTDRVMMFNVVAPAPGTPADTSRPPGQLTNLNRTDPIARPTLADLAVTPRQVALYETLDHMGRITPLMGTPGSSAEFLDPITEDPALGTPEVWQIYNNTADTHPIHLHQVAYQVLARQAFSTKLVNLGPSPSGHTTMWGMSNTRLLGAPALAVGNEVAWKDTIQINPGEVVTVRAKFDLPGKYVTHCHILSHEEHDMMRFMQVGDEAFPPPGYVVNSSGARVEPVITGVLATHSGHSGATFSTVAVAAIPKDKKILTVAKQVLA